MVRRRFDALLLAACALLGTIAAIPANAVDGQVLITQAKALAGGVTPGDAPGFPVTLSEPGSYKLASNLSPPPGDDGIVTNAPDITIDLNGFRISGGPAGGTNNAINGIRGRGDRLTVKNGTIGGFEGNGILLRDRDYLIVENMLIINNRFGISNSDGSFARIQNSTIATNGSHGIQCTSSCHVEGNVVSSNGGYGVLIGTGTVLGNTIIGNGLSGIWANGAGLGNNSLVSNNNNGDQVVGSFSELHPNFCFPAPC
jgi:hypothetical protein